MKRKKSLPVLELTWLLLFVLMSFIKTFAQQTKFIEGTQLKPFIHFPRGAHHPSCNGFHVPNRTYYGTLNNTEHNKN